MLLVDDYGYETISEYETNVSIADKSISVSPEISWTDMVVAYWLFFGAIIVLNLFIGEQPSCQNLSLKGRGYELTPDNTPA